MFYFIYHLDLWVVILTIFFLIIFCGGFMRLISGKSSKFAGILAIAAAAVSLAGILYVSLRNRTAGDYELILMPFHSFIEAEEQPEMYRSMLMNVFLYVPFGISLPYVIGFIRDGRESKIKKSGRLNPLFYTVISALILTVIMESLQYFLHIGRAETDDVICNTFGAFLGSLSYIFTLMKHKNKT